MQLLRHLLTSATLALIATAASANDIQVVPVTHPDGSPSQPEVYLSGEITDQTVTQLSAMIRERRLQSSIVYLDSAGGDPQAGMDLGDLLRRSNINTAVGKVGRAPGRPAAGKCQSACVLTYAGGKFRFIDPASQLGIHRFYRRTATATDLDVAQVMSAAITAYLIRMDIDPALFERMVKVGRGQMEMLAARDALALNLVNNGLLPSKWGIEGKSGSVYLLGEQETWNGTGKIIMTCVPNQKAIKISALYDAGAQNASIAKSTVNYSLRINQRFIPIGQMLTKASISGSYLLASFIPTDPMMWEINAADKIGFGFHPGQADTFYGFLVDATGEQDLIRSWVKHCTER
ncbi:hypothetical protein ABH908_000520 [Pseudomonas frederiksbergensis]|uniref:COG3904 family protein n=1 Tax=Pseudomonas TaxID=286 RepID=UPI003D22E337